MEIERKIGKELERWVISHKGYGWYETYGQSMTDWASFYTIDRLLEVKNKDIIHIENALPKEIGSMKELLLTIITEIEKEERRNPERKETLDALNKIPLIKKKIEKLHP